jgi:hypothetical protein
MILPTAFLPPVSYFSKIRNSETITVEAQEHFIKQTIRNHCEIQSANGRLKLSVPVDHRDRWKIPIGELSIAKGEDWQRKHLRSIRSAYGKSPYYEYYCDDFEAILLKDYTNLFELNNTLLLQTMKWLKLQVKIQTTIFYESQISDSEDFRSSWNDPALAPSNEKKYTQVFSSKFDFMSNLSIIDLLFNCGPDATSYL